MSATRNAGWMVVEHGAILSEHVTTMPSSDVADMLDKAATLGFAMGPESPLSDVTVAELEMLTQDLTTN